MNTQAGFYCYSSAELSLNLVSMLRITRPWHQHQLQLQLSLGRLQIHDIHAGLGLV